MTKPFMKAGWTFVVETWENDGDARRTETHTVTTIEEAKILAGVIYSFEEGEDLISNLYDPADDEIASVGAAAAKWGKAHVEFFNANQKKAVEVFEKTKDPDMILDTFMDQAFKIGLAGSGDFYTRVLEKWNVYYNSTDIHLNDVTAEFKA